MDFCQFFRDIEKDPTAIVPELTVREYLAARAHLASCDDCYQVAERVAALAPDSDETIFPSAN
jgi:hypothetical protein